MSEQVILAICAVLVAAITLAGHVLQALLTLRNTKKLENLSKTTLEVKVLSDGRFTELGNELRHVKEHLAVALMALDAVESSNSTVNSELRVGTERKEGK